MIEIKCTKEEKETITKIFADVPVCVINYHDCRKYNECMKCINDNIKWIITDNQLVQIIEYIELTIPHNKAIFILKLEVIHK